MNKKDISDPQARATAAHVSRRKAQGFKQIRIWVPADDVERVKKYAAKLRLEFLKRSKP